VKSLVYAVTSLTWKITMLLLGGAKRLAVERFGDPVAETVALPLLVEVGFLAGPRRAVRRE
jgi:hypothetical protein